MTLKELAIQVELIKAAAEKISEAVDEFEYQGATLASYNEAMKDRISALGKQIQDIESERDKFKALLEEAANIADQYCHPPNLRPAVAGGGIGGFGAQTIQLGTFTTTVRLDSGKIFRDKERINALKELARGK